jgi:hypothetical protein
VKPESGGIRGRGSRRRGRSEIAQRRIRCLRSSVVDNDGSCPQPTRRKRASFTAARPACECHTSRQRVQLPSHVDIAYVTLTRSDNSTISTSSEVSLILQGFSLARPSEATRLDSCSISARLTLVCQSLNQYEHLQGSHALLCLHPLRLDYWSSAVWLPSRMYLSLMWFATSHPDALFNRQNSTRRNPSLPVRRSPSRRLSRQVCRNASL